MQRVNALEDLNTHYNLKGAIFKKKNCNPDQLKGLGFFGFAAGAYAYYPYVAMHIGQSLTTSLITAACVGGMYMFRNSTTIVNSITMEDDGRLRFNVSDSLVGSRDLTVSVQDVHSMISLSNDDVGEEDIESGYL